MGLLTVEGVYKNGKVELAERPGHVEGTARVLVTFLASSGPPGEPIGHENQDREALRQRAFARMKEGIHLGGLPYLKREDLHDRFDDSARVDCDG